MDASPKRVGAITIFVEDLPVAKAFYRDVFGLTEMFEDADSVVFEFGTTLINLLTVAAAHDLIEPGIVGSRDAGSRVQLTIWVDDVDAARADLRSRGVTLLNGPMDRAWGMRTASFTDPAGTIWEIAQKLSTSED
ncbi:MAG: VOC family protein [Thermomicrobiales bacterium]